MNLLSRAAKRAFDLTAASAGLVVTGLPLAAVAVAIKVDSPGPVFYRGERVGLHGKAFRIFKFRSMHMHDGTGPHTTKDGDARVTRVGKLIRRYKLDELSQLINVVLGDMSLVGPRPEVRWCVDLYTAEEKSILTVRPGITDWASIKFHNEGEIIAASDYDDPDQAYLELIRPEKLRLQLKYVRERTMWTDIQIILETLRKLFATRTGLESSSTASAQVPAAQSPPRSTLA
ncbi:MAG: sugar transferase [Polyangiaceae bacterium]|nr:sugar transferase [Polyangiaceae bacterium]